MPRIRDMTTGQTPEEKGPDRPGEPSSNSPENVAPTSNAANTTPDGASDQASASAAAAAAVSAVSAAIAATTKASAKASPKATKAPLTVEGYVRAPGRDVPGLTRARAQAPESVEAAVPAEPVDPYKKYKRPAPDAPDTVRTEHLVLGAGVAGAASIPIDPEVGPAAAATSHATEALPEIQGITRATHDEIERVDEAARPAPLFSNEGAVRAAQDRHRNPVAGAVSGAFETVLDAGTALGHSIGSHSPGTKTAIASPAPSPRTSARTHRRRTVFVLGSMAFVLLIAVGMTSILLPSPDNGNNNLIPRSSGASGNPADIWNGQVDPNASVDPRADASGVAIGDESLAPGATRRPSPTPSGSFCWYIPTPAPTPTTSGSPSPSPSSSSSSSVLVTPQPTPTAIRTACPAPRVTRSPTPVPSGGATSSATATASATDTPTPTAVPTPTPTPEMFAEIDPQTLPTWAGNDGSFWVASLPAASCYLTLTMGGGPVLKQTVPFQIDVSGEHPGWVLLWWGHTWPASVAGQTVTVRATCKAAAPDTRTATFSLDLLWPPYAPTPPPATPTPIPT